MELMSSNLRAIARNCPRLLPEFLAYGLCKAIATIGFFFLLIVYLAFDAIRISCTWINKAPRHIAGFFFDRFDAWYERLRRLYDELTPDEQTE